MTPKSADFDYQLTLRPKEDKQEVVVIIVLYIGAISKQEKARMLLNAYYEAVENSASSEHPLEFAARAVELCRDLQRLHVFSDGNGRLFFALLSALLVDGGWLPHKMPDNPWKVDLCSAKAYAKEIVLSKLPNTKQCSDAIDWPIGQAIIHKVKLACQEGDLQRLKTMMSSDRSLHALTLVPPTQRSLMFVAVAAGQLAIVKYLSDHLNEPLPMEEKEVFLNEMFKHDYADILKFLLSHYLFPKDLVIFSVFKGLCTLNASIAFLFCRLQVSLKI